jgi:hypothetical protein
LEASGFFGAWSSEFGAFHFPPLAVSFARILQ